MSENLGVWIGGIVGFILFLWPEIVMPEMKWITQAALAEISSEYDNVNSYYLGYGLLWMAVIISLILLFASISRQFEFNTKQVQLIVSIWLVVMFSSFGCVKGMVAVKKGIYPTSKFFGARTWYIYGEADWIRWLGCVQIYVAAGAVVIAILFGSIFWYYVR
ncbi:MAG: hypothetical protein GY832_16050 [Chloroflexi bacterium]|nr:hypothetical protein [Chloroflexota bacterium]